MEHARAEASQEVGLDPFYEGNMEPWGAVCVGYVKQDTSRFP